MVGEIGAPPAVGGLQRERPVDRPGLVVPPNPQEGLGVAGREEAG